MEAQVEVHRRVFERAGDAHLQPAGASGTVGDDGHGLADRRVGRPDAAQHAAEDFAAVRPASPVGSAVHGRINVAVVQLQAVLNPVDQNAGRNRRNLLFDFAGRLQFV